MKNNFLRFKCNFRTYILEVVKGGGKGKRVSGTNPQALPRKEKEAVG